MSRVTSGWRWLLAGGLVLVGAAVALVVLAGQVTPNTIGYEVAKNLAQFLTVSLLTAVVAAVVSVLQRRGEERRRSLDAYDEALRRLRADITEAYRGVKRARRVLRAAAGPLDAGLPLPLDEYRAQMEVINDFQLDFEEAREAARNLEDGRVDAKDLAGQLRKVEKYLHELVDEYSDENRALVAGSTSAASLERLARFVARRKEGGDFRDEIASRVHGVERSLDAALRKPWTAP